MKKESIYIPETLEGFSVHVLPLDQSRQKLLPDQHVKIREELDSLYLEAVNSFSEGDIEKARKTANDYLEALLGLENEEYRPQLFTLAMHPYLSIDLKRNFRLAQPQASSSEFTDQEEDLYPQKYSVEDLFSPMCLEIRNTYRKNLIANTSKTETETGMEDKEFVEHKVDEALTSLCTIVATGLLEAIDNNSYIVAPASDEIIESI